MCYFLVLWYYYYHVTVFQENIPFVSGLTFLVFSKNLECKKGHNRFADVLFLRTHGCTHSPKDCLTKTKQFLAGQSQLYN